MFQIYVAMLLTAVVIHIHSIDSKLCFQPFTSHCRAKPETLCYSSKYPVPPNHHLTTQFLAGTCSLSLAILAEPFPERKKTNR